MELGYQFSSTARVSPLLGRGLAVSMSAAQQRVMSSSPVGGATQRFIKPGGPSPLHLWPLQDCLVGQMTWNSLHEAYWRTCFLLMFDGVFIWHSASGQSLVRWTRLHHHNLGSSLHMVTCLYQPYPLVVFSRLFLHRLLITLWLAFLTCLLITLYTILLTSHRHPSLACFINNFMSITLTYRLYTSSCWCHFCGGVFVNA